MQMIAKEEAEKRMNELWYKIVECLTEKGVTNLTPFMETDVQYVLYEAQKNYAEYTDANKNVILQSVSIEQERLQNEMSLAFQTYSNVANQLQMAKAKVQEAKPVFALVEPATVPLKPSGRGRGMTVILTVFLIVAGTGAWILFGKDFMAQLKQGLKEPKEK
jgi:L-rhamnose mutarotase